MYTNYDSNAVAENSQQQQFWQAPPPQQPQYNQQYGQVYQQHGYGNNANQFYPQPQTQYNQNYTAQTYGNDVQQEFQQNYFHNQGQQQHNFSQNKGKSDGWDNWDWGWEDSSKAQKGVAPAALTPQMQQQAPLPTSQPAFNNANVIEESFGTTDSWNWSMEDKKLAKDQLPTSNQEIEHPATLNVGAPIENNLDNDTPSNSINPTNQRMTEDVRTLHDGDIVKERMPNLALGKRFHIDNLTPQWSIESQMSQDSSDGPLTHSEGGTFRSEIQSRNSDKSNYSQHSLDEPYSQNPEWSKLSAEEPSLADNIQTNASKIESHSDLTNSMQVMSIANRENPPTDSLHRKESLSDNIQVQPSMSASPSSLPPSMPVNQPVQPPSLSTPSSAPLPPVSSILPPPPPLSSATLPPTNFPPTITSQNPFKIAGPFSHKTAAKAVSSSASNQAFPPPMSNTSLTSPAVVNKASQHSRAPIGFSANLETTPDNSERPDQPQVLAFRPMPVSHQVPENLEVAPQNDRNEYLQTAHLSSSDYGENTDFSGNIPPPGLRRMVVGQQESEYNQNLNISADEPPPGLARMVPGQQNEAENITYNQSGENYLDRHIDGQPDNYPQAGASRGPERRPVGRDRTVPGEPSNAEYPQYQGPTYAGASEPRVVTGVDHDYPLPADGGPSDVREQNVDGSDYTIQRNSSRNLTGVRETGGDASTEFAVPDDQQREVTMEGENLQDLSIISSTELSHSREHVLDGADVTAIDAVTDRKTDASDSIEHPVTSSRRQSLNHVITSGDDSERDRSFKASPRRDKHRSSRDRDRDRDKEGRYSRGERKLDRDGERRSGRDRDERWPEKERRERDERERRDRDESPEARRARRSARQRRYETEDTDYYSDRERERRYVHLHTTDMEFCMMQ